MQVLQRIIGILFYMLVTVRPAWCWAPAVRVTTTTTTRTSAAAGESSFPRRGSSILWNDQRQSSESSTIATTEIDVSDLGLTMDDLNAPLPKDLFQVIETSGYESTSRIPSVYDDACFWTETPTDVSVRLALPGLRGQPPMALSVLTSRNTISVAVFGRIVWSAILRGETLPETATFETREGVDFVPVIEYTVHKADVANSQRRWDGFILQVGEDSLL